MPEMYITVCQPCFQGSDFYERLKEEVAAAGLPVKVEDSCCLGGCSIGQRVNITLPHRGEVRFASSDTERYQGIGTDPMQRIIETSRYLHDQGDQDS